MIIGYARVSSDGQTLGAQQAALAGAGAERVFAEKVSGRDRALGRAIAALGPGDVLLVTRSIDLHAQLAICSMCSIRSPRLAQVSSRWPMLGPTPPHRTDD